MTISDTFLHEWRTRLARPAIIMSLVLFVLLLFYAAVSGEMQRDARIDAITNHQTQTATTMQHWFNDLKLLEEKGAESGVRPWFGSAMDMKFATFLMPAPLADFAIGQSDLLPYFGAVSLWDTDIRLFSKYEFEDPISLALGTFDLAKAIIFILPLLIIVLSFDVLSAERDANRLGLIFAQGANVRSIFWRRLLIRGSIIVGLALLVMLWSLLQHGGPITIWERLPSFALWIVATLSYSAFWLALIAYVTSQNRQGEVNVILLLLAWAGLTLILPASATAVSEAIFPAPSRVAYLAETREVENATQLAEADIANQFIIDHPEMLINESSKIPEHVRTAFFVTSTVDDATRPLLLDFEHTAMQRDEMLNTLRFLSPAMIIHNLFNDITGTSSVYHRRYMSSARAFKAKFATLTGPRIVAGSRFPLDQVASLPSFVFEDDSIIVVFKRNLGALFFLFSCAGLLLFFADRHVRALKGCSH